MLGSTSVSMQVNELLPTTTGMQTLHGRSLAQLSAITIRRWRGVLRKPMWHRYIEKHNEFNSVQMVLQIKKCNAFSSFSVTYEKVEYKTI